MDSVTIHVTLPKTWHRSLQRRGAPSKLARKAIEHYYGFGVSDPDIEKRLLVTPEMFRAVVTLILTHSITGTLPKPIVRKLNKFLKDYCEGTPLDALQPFISMATQYTPPAKRNIK
jgi:hypothetical protein